MVVGLEDTTDIGAGAGSRLAAGAGGSADGGGGTGFARFTHSSVWLIFLF